MAVRVNVDEGAKRERPLQGELSPQCDCDLATAVLY